MKENEFLKELEKNNILVSKAQLEMLNKYKKYLQEQNKLYNLTALITDEDIYLKHFYILKHIQLLKLLLISVE